MQVRVRAQQDAGSSRTQTTHRAAVATCRSVGLAGGEHPHPGCGRQPDEVVEQLIGRRPVGRVEQLGQVIDRDDRPQPVGVVGFSAARIDATSGVGQRALERSDCAVGSVAVQHHERHVAVVGSLRGSEQLIRQQP